MLLGEPADRLTIRAHPLEHDPPVGSGVEFPASTGDLQAGRKAFDIPFEWSGVGLVEIIDVEDQVTFRRGESPEVGQVSVAAELYVDARTGKGGQVCRHGQRGTSEVRKGGRRHAAVADRHQLGHPSRSLLCQQGQRIELPLGRLPLAVAVSGTQLSGLFARRGAVSDGGIGQIGTLTDGHRDSFSVLHLCSCLEGWEVRTGPSADGARP